MSQKNAELCKRIGYSFIDDNLLDLAISHRSHSSLNNERLEFLGDSVLGFVVAENLYQRFGSATEGQLSRARSQIVKGETLAKVARSFDLGQFLNLGEGELKSGGFDRSSILADAMEAIIGAVYLDRGYQAVKYFIHHHFESLLNSVNPLNASKDPKTLLQELLQQYQQPLPRYLVKEIQGASHVQNFSVECFLPATNQAFIGTGSSKRRAEQAAATDALHSLEAPTNNAG
ncbi:MAG: ribonuclease-3 [Gammaproteobacteria bacterium]